MEGGLGLRLSYKEIEKWGVKGPRKKVGYIAFACPRCSLKLKRVVWATLIGEGSPDCDKKYAFAKCPCGAKILVTCHPDGREEVRVMNEEQLKKMPRGDRCQYCLYWKVKGDVGFCTADPMEHCLTPPNLRRTGWFNRIKKKRR